MKYEIIKGCAVGTARYKVGDIVTLSEENAKILLGLKRVTPYDEPVKLEDRSVGLSEDKPKPKRRAKK
jgi:hypothetical protein